ncbi:hypothetical protein [Brachybacterium saurashtrense]|uniref:ESX secretion-associated protein EspG n=1 Tax=Brachybacterium saurashtrense TaxID=556288 RepID=A0A345YQE3_9MICO|nr:hypothetical protein [Brachybacterium saurashtrense]AXK46145.1 hypothetical protein DWV08_11360 [Brachybacterium saurashtrense]RRR23885.1 hypothetical protein DXU92_03110 [Brachybacterium saurashtrense]
MTSPQSAPSGAPRFSAEDVEIATALLTQPLEQPVTEVVTLTDEELMALDGIEQEPLTPTPWVSGSAEDEDSRALVAAAAMRSMISRGIVSSAAVLDPRRYEDGSQEQARIVAVPALQGTMVLRRTADAVLIAERQTERGTAYGYFYLFHVDGGVRVLWEAFDATGFHLFFLLEGGTLPEQLRAFVDPVAGAGEVEGEVEEVPAASFATSAVAQRLADARAVTTVLVLDREDTAGPTAFTLFSTPDALELMETDGEGEAAIQRVGAVSAATLEGLIEELVAGTRPGAGAAR